LKPVRIFQPPLHAETGSAVQTEGALLGMKPGLPIIQTTPAASLIPAASDALSTSPAAGKQPIKRTVADCREKE